MMVGTAQKELERHAELEIEYRDNLEIEKVIEQERMEEIAKQEEERRR
jgi:hypothetical protein